MYVALIEMLSQISLNNLYESSRCKNQLKAISHTLFSGFPNWTVPIFQSTRIYLDFQPILSIQFQLKFQECVAS